MSEEKGTTPQTGIQYIRATDFINRYANNVFMESSLWDLKLIFGQNDQNVGPNAVAQFGAITLPWPQVKILSYLLDLNIAVHEAANGRVSLAPGVLTPIPDEIPDAVANHPAGTKMHEVAKRIYDEFVKENPEVLPK